MTTVTTTDNKLQLMQEYARISAKNTMPFTDTMPSDYDSDLQRRREEHLKKVKRFRWGDGEKRCAHDACTQCVGTGVKIDGSRCIHMISCSCPRCTPYCFSA